MKIKHFLMMLLCTAGVTFMTASCEDLFPLDNEEDNTEENNGGDEGDNGNNQSGNEEEDKLLSLSKQMFDAIPAGIYISLKRYGTRKASRHFRRSCRSSS